MVGEPRRRDGGVAVLRRAVSGFGATWGSSKHGRSRGFQSVSEQGILERGRSRGLMWFSFEGGGWKWRKADLALA
ncbi:hypothetical protein LIER_17111 [Lithospermum erythrorhizon]|uniref:Uncharacterized protein n=1 Tax=Lithospermum erythrorhizon TaxID=34254 RepID=A0AAV3QBJ5_LITER